MNRRTVITALAIAFGLSVTPAPPAQAATVGNYIILTSNSDDTLLIWDYWGTIRDLRPGSTSWRVGWENLQKFRVRSGYYAENLNTGYRYYGGAYGKTFVFASNNNRLVLYNHKIVRSGSWSPAQ